MADLADREAGDRLVEQAWSLWGGLDAWLHIAGADTLTGEAARLPFDEKLDLLWSIDVVATVRLCRAVGRLMKGRVAARSSPWGGTRPRRAWRVTRASSSPRPREPSWRSPASLALSLAPDVRVNAVAPGWIKTEWGEGASQSLAGSCPPRDPAAPLGHPGRRRPGRPLPGQPGRGVPDRPDHPRQRRSGPLLTSSRISTSRSFAERPKPSIRAACPRRRGHDAELTDHGGSAPIPVRHRPARRVRAPPGPRPTGLRGRFRGRGRRPADHRGRPDDAPLGRPTPRGPRRASIGFSCRAIAAATSARSSRRPPGIPVETRAGRPARTCPATSARPIGRRPNMARTRSRSWPRSIMPPACRSRN